MKLIKSIITLSILTILASCSDSVPEKVTSNVTSESYDWKKWDCYEFAQDGMYLFTIGYIPELKKDSFYEGKLFMKDTTLPIDTLYSLRGVQHSFVWLPTDKESYQIVIDSDGIGRFWDFTGAEEGESRDSKETYKCTSSGLEEFNRVMNILF